jgi:hypothetical protein
MELTGAGAVGAALLSLVAGSVGVVRLWPPGDPCPGDAAPKIERLKRIEGERFASLDHATVAGDGCDDTGRPSAYLQLRIDGWTSRRQGIAFLRRPPWHWDGHRQLATLDGEPAVLAGVTKTADDSGPWILLHLDLPA